MTKHEEGAGCPFSAKAKELWKTGNKDLVLLNSAIGGQLSAGHKDAVLVFF